MTDIMTPQQRSRVMARNRGKNTSPERYLHRLAAAAGMSFVRHDSSLPGTPDLTFPAAKLAVFIDGDFWHGWRFPTWKHRLSPFWAEKITLNRWRDNLNHRRLRSMGWRILRIWEHQVEEDIIACVKKVAKMSRSRIDHGALLACYASMPRLKRRKRLPKP